MAIEVANKKQQLLMKYFVNVNKLEPLSFTYVQFTLLSKQNESNKTFT